MTTMERFAGMSATGAAEQQLNVSVPSSQVPGQRSPGLTTKPPSPAQVFTLYRASGRVVAGESVGEDDGVEGAWTGESVLRVFTGDAVTGGVPAGGVAVFVGAGVGLLPGPGTEAQPAAISMTDTRIARARKPRCTVPLMSASPHLVRSITEGD
jgi:hypothetical protein